MRRTTSVISAISAAILLVILFCGIYVSDYYAASDEAVKALASDNGISVEVLQDKVIFSPSLPKAGFIFYPGGKVEFTAYAPLMEALAERNILCVLLQMPGNLAVLDMDAANGISEQFPELDQWYIGGHSLGGSMAASYVSKSTEEFEGLALLASYSTANLSDTELQVISLFGTEDGVLNREKYEKYRSNLPQDAVEISIEGGNHAYFGSYGNQEGDGTASIIPQQQVQITADALAAFFTE